MFASRSGFSIAAPLAVTLALAFAVDVPSDRGRAFEARCELATEWHAGDVYWWQILRLAEGGAGEWHDGDRHTGGTTSVYFRWVANDRELQIDVSGERYVSRYEIEQVDHACVLRFDREPLPHSFREFGAAASDDAQSRPASDR